jgi:hypothetical protein
LTLLMTMFMEPRWSGRAGRPTIDDEMLSRTRP